MVRDTGMMVLASRAFRSQVLQASCSTACLQSHCAQSSMCDGIDSAFASQLQQQRWMAVPKRKTSPHRRGMRNANKYLRRINAASKCGKCGEVFGILDVHFCKPDPQLAESKGGGQSKDLAVKQVDDLDWNASTNL